MHYVRRHGLDQSCLVTYLHEDNAVDLLGASLGDIRGRPTHPVVLTVYCPMSGLLKCLIELPKREVGLVVTLVFSIVA